LAPHWAGGRPRRIGDEDVAFGVSVALMRQKKRGLRFTHWSVRKLAGYVSGRYGHKDPDPDLVPAQLVRIGRERVRRVLPRARHLLPTHPDLEGVHRPRL
jgi:hypothetical protein